MFTLPTIPSSPAAQDAPDRLAPHEKLQLRAAAHRAKQLYPGPVGQLISDEFHAVDEFGYVFLNGGRTAQLLAHVLAAPLPGQSHGGSDTADGASATASRCRADIHAASASS